MQDFNAIAYLLKELQNTPFTEMVAVFFAVVQVVLAYKNKISLYWAGIISTSLYIWIYSRPEVALYANASLNSYYLIMSIYGLVFWSKKVDGKEEHKIAHASRKEIMITLLISIVSFVLMFFVLKKYTDSNTPVFDALVAAIAWAGMWLLARRKIENWIVLNCSNAIAIPLLCYKHLLLTALLTVFLFVMAVLGYRNWKRMM